MGVRRERTPAGIGMTCSPAGSRLARWTCVLAILSLLPLGAQQSARRVEQARLKRADPARFENKTKAADFAFAASFTGRSMIAPERSVLLRNYLVVEVLLIPLRRTATRVDLSAFGLKVNGESHYRLPQSPGVAAYAVRNPELREGPRLAAGASIGGGSVVWDSEGRRTSPRFPGDPRVPTRRPTVDRDAPRVADAAEVDAEAVVANAFPEGIALDPVVGYLYFPAEIDLQRIRKLELVFRPEPENSRNSRSPEAVLRLK